MIAFRGAGVRVPEMTTFICKEKEIRCTHSYQVVDNQNCTYLDPICFYPNVLHTVWLFLKVSSFYSYFSVNVNAETVYIGKKRKSLMLMKKLC